MLLDLHVHSRFSPDCLSSPDALLEAARRHGLNGIAVTDHNTVRGGLETRDRNRDPDFHVIVGSEVKTDAGDVIGLFLEKEVASQGVLEVIDEIHAQGGLALLPHPFRGRIPRDAVATAVDLIEVFNSRTEPDGNRKAQELAARLGKPQVSCSDAHFVSDLGGCSVAVEGAVVRTALLQGRGTLRIGYTQAYKMSASQIVKSFRSGHYSGIPYHGARMVKRIIWGF